MAAVYQLTSLPAGSSASRDTVPVPHLVMPEFVVEMDGLLTRTSTVLEVLVPPNAQVTRNRYHLGVLITPVNAEYGLVCPAKGLNTRLSKDTSHW